METKKSTVCILWRWEEALQCEGHTPPGGYGTHSGGLPPGTVAFVWATKNNELYLMGALQVKSSTNHEMHGKSLFGSFRIIPLKSTKWRLRFIGTRDRLRKNATLPLQVRARRWITEESAAMLRELLGTASEQLTEVSKDVRLWEKRYANRNIYTRVANPALRDLALAQYGSQCQVCGLDFVSRYGKFAKYCVEVHHLKPRAETKSGVSTGLTDVAVLCPNCHRAFHRYPGSYIQFSKQTRARINPKK